MNEYTWNMQEYAGICKNIPEYMGMCMSMQEHVRIDRNMQAYAGICKNNNNMQEYIYIYV